MSEQINLNKEKLGITFSPNVYGNLFKIIFTDVRFYFQFSLLTLCILSTTTTVGLYISGFMMIYLIGNGIMLGILLDIYMIVFMFLYCSIYSMYCVI